MWRGVARAAAADSVVGARLFHEFVEVCASWPKAELPDDWSEPVASDVPVLLMNGEVDPATPPTAARAAAQTLSNAVVVTFPSVAHGTANAGSCVNQLIRAFLDNPDPAALEHACARASERPPFVISPR